MSKIRIVRMCRHLAVKGGRHRYFLADVEASSVAAAVKAATEGRVDWRPVHDIYHLQAQAFEYFEVICSKPHRSRSFELIRKVTPENPSHRWHRGHREGSGRDMRFYPKTRNLALEAKLQSATTCKMNQTVVG